MAHEAGAVELPGVDPDRSPSGPVPQPPRLLALGLSVILVAIGAIAFASLLAVGFVLVLYLPQGTDGITDFYEDFRFDLRLKTFVSSVVVGTLYAGVALSTILTAVLHARGRWPALVAWRPVQGTRGALIVIFAATILYGVAATMILARTRDHHVLIAGNTDVALLAMIAANLVLFAPIAEELLFRGWLYTGLRARLPFLPTLLVTVALFAATHWGAGRRRTLLVLPLAVALGILREVTGSIKPTITLHASYNLAIIALTLLES